ncbi:hypothetical protein BDA99DRAFT_522325, partial [Phascolomyces articulosus]
MRKKNYKYHTWMYINTYIFFSFLAHFTFFFCCFFMSQQLLASTSNNKSNSDNNSLPFNNNNSTGKFPATAIEEEVGEVEENHDFLQSSLTPSITISEPHISFKNQPKNRPVHASENKFMKLMDEYMVTEDNIQEHHRRQRHHHRRQSSSKHSNKQQQRTLPLDIPFSSSSLSSSSSMFHSSIVTPTQKITTKPVLSATCPVYSTSSGRRKNNQFMLTKHNNVEFTVGSMPEKESPVPWPSQMLDHVRTPDGMAQFSDYISPSTSPDSSATTDMIDEPSPLLFNMD